MRRRSDRKERDDSLCRGHDSPPEDMGPRRHAEDHHCFHGGAEGDREDHGRRRLQLHCGACRRGQVQVLDLRRHGGVAADSFRVGGGRRGHCEPLRARAHGRRVPERPGLDNRPRGEWQVPHPCGRRGRAGLHAQLRHDRYAEAREPRRSRRRQRHGGGVCRRRLRARPPQRPAERLLRQRHRRDALQGEAREGRGLFLCDRGRRGAARDGALRLEGRCARVVQGRDDALRLRLRPLVCVHDGRGLLGRRVRGPCRRRGGRTVWQVGQVLGEDADARRGRACRRMGRRRRHVCRRVRPCPGDGRVHGARAAHARGGGFRRLLPHRRAERPFVRAQVGPRRDFGDF